MKRFKNNRGYYIALFLCLALTIATGYIARTRSEQQKQEELARQQTVTANETLTQPFGPSLPSMSEKIQPEPTKAPEATEKPKVRATTDEPQPEPTQEPKKEETMLPPLDGETIKLFNNKELVYSATFHDWRTHPGVDLAAQQGEKVCAILSGTVEKVYTDDYYGITILIDHGNGLKSQYSNLSTEKMVTAGQAVKQGDVISGVGETALSEVSESPHLHYAILKDGAYVDPASLTETK